MRQALATYLVTQNRYADMTLLVDSRVVDLGRKCDLLIAPREWLTKGCLGYNGGRTDGALNGKFSGRVRVKLNVPPLYGLFDFVG